jgi:chromosome segregation ATPase
MQRIQELVIGWEEEIKRVQKARQEASRLQLRLDNGQDELRIQRNRCEMFQSLLRVETRNHAQTHARLTDVEAMNLKWQDKYEAARAEVRRLQVDLIRVHNELSDARDVIKAFEAEKERN